MRLLALLLCACGSGITLPPVPPTTGPAELRAALDEARQAWADAGVEPADVEQIAWADAERMPRVCGYGDGTPVQACATIGRIWVRVGLDRDARFVGIITHELGHLTRDAHWGSARHLPCDSTPGDALMCDGGSDEMVITDRDISYALGEPI